MAWRKVCRWARGGRDARGPGLHKENGAVSSRSIGSSLRASAQAAYLRTSSSSRRKFRNRRSCT